MVQSETNVLSGNGSGAVCKDKRKVNKAMCVGCAGCSAVRRLAVQQGTLKARIEFWEWAYGIAMYKAGQREEAIIYGGRRRYLEIAEYALKRLEVYL